MADVHTRSHFEWPDTRTHYKNAVGNLAGHQISSVILVVLFFGVLYLTYRHEVLRMSIGQLFAVGIMCAVLSALFDFGFGHYVDHVSWDVLLADYNIFEGNLWGAVLLFIACSPWLLYIFQTRILGHGNLMKA